MLASNTDFQASLQILLLPQHFVVRTSRHRVSDKVLRLGKEALPVSLASQLCCSKCLFSSSVNLPFIFFFLVTCLNVHCMKYYKTGFISTDLKLEADDESLHIKIVVAATLVCLK